MGKKLDSNRCSINQEITRINFYVDFKLNQSHFRSKKTDFGFMMRSPSKK